MFYNGTTRETGVRIISYTTSASENILNSSYYQKNCAIRRSYWLKNSWEGYLRLFTSLYQLM